MTTFDDLWKGKNQLRQSTILTRDPFSLGAMILGGLGASSAFLGTALGFFAAGAIGYIASTVVTNFLLSALAPKPKGGSANSANSLTNQMSTVTPRELIYGVVRKGGLVSYMESNGDDNNMLHMAIVIAAHPCDAIVDYYIDDKIVTLDANGFVTGTTWNSKVKIIPCLGDGSTAARDAMIAAGCSIDSNFKGTGLTWLYIQAKFDREIFRQGLPTFTVKIRGKKVYDPRTGNTEWSDNAALCIRDYLISAQGGKVPTAMIDDADMAQQANVSDQTVTLSGSTVKQYRINGVVSTGNSPRANLEQMLTACAGTVFRSAGFFRLKTGHYTAPVMTLDYNNIRGPIQIEPRISRRDNFNAVSGTFNNSAQNYITVDYNKVKNNAFLAQDNGRESLLDLPLPFTTDSPTARFLARQALFRAREQITFSTVMNLESFKADVGDTIAVTLDRYGWNNKPFELNSWRLTLDDNGVLVVEVTLRETSAAAYGVDGTAEDIIGNDTNLPQGLNGDPPTNLAVINSGKVRADGTFIPAMEVTWNAATSAFTDYYVVRWKKNSVTRWQQRRTNDNSCLIASVEENELYNIQVYSVNVYGAKSTSVQTNFTPGKDTIAPGMPTWGSVTSKNGAVTLSWTRPSDTDFSHVEILQSSTNTIGSASIVARVSADAYVHTQVSPGTTYYYWLRAVDFSGNKSAATASRSILARAVAVSDIAQEVFDNMTSIAAQTGITSVSSLPATGAFGNQLVMLIGTGEIFRWNAATGQWTRELYAGIKPGDVDLTKFASGIEPVTISSSPTLPTTKLTATIVWGNKIYRWNGTAYVASVPAVDITGQITSGQIASNAVLNSALADAAVSVVKIADGAVTSTKVADLAITTAKFATGLRPVEIVSSLPTTGNFDGRQAYLTTDKRLYRHNGTSWINTNAADQIVGQLTAGQITAGAIGATHIAANAIVASKLLLTDFTNLAGSSDFLDESFWTPAAASTTLGYITPGSTIWNSAKLLGVSAAAGIHGVANGRTLKVTGGEKFLISCNARVSEGTGMCFIQMQSSATPDFASATHIIAASTTSTDVTLLSNEYTVPAGHLYMRPRLVLNNDNATQCLFGNVVLMRKTSGTMIVNGAITTDKIAANAITSATIAANAITSVTIASGAITTAKIAAGAITANEIAAGTINTSHMIAGAVTASILAADSVTATKIATNAVTSDAIAANSIVVGKVAAGAIRAEELAVSAISSRHLAIGNLVNLFDGADSLSTSPFRPEAHVNAGNGFWDTATVYLGQSTLGISSGWGVGVQYRMVPIPVIPGTSYYVEFYVNRNSTWDGTPTNSKLRFGDGTGGFIADLGFAASQTTSGTWVKRSLTFTIPTGVTQLNITLVSDATQGWARLGGMLMRQRNGGELLVDGSITTNHISAGSVVASSIAAGAITATAIATGAITAIKIAAGAVTADKLSVTSLSAITATIGTLRTATTGERLEIQDNMILVYDANNVVRVRIGEL